MLKRHIYTFWRWYEQNYTLAVGVSGGLFLLQLIHLYWLLTDVVAFRLLGQSYFDPTGTWEFLIVVVDYLEIPTLISVSLIYINELRRRNNFKSWLLLLLLNSQWIHIFWITDEIAEEIFTGAGSTILPAWAAWIAIAIDYLELPVIMDIVVKFIRAVRARRIREFLQDEFIENEPR